MLQAYVDELGVQAGQDGDRRTLHLDDCFLVLTHGWNPIFFRCAATFSLRSATLSASFGSGVLSRSAKAPSSPPCSSSISAICAATLSRAVSCSCMAACCLAK